MGPPNGQLGMNNDFTPKTTTAITVTTVTTTVTTVTIVTIVTLVDLTQTPPWNLEIVIQGWPDMGIGDGFVWRKKERIVEIKLKQQMFTTVLF